MKKFGLIGSSLSHSFSKKYFTDKFEQLGISSTAMYENFEMKSLEGFRQWIKSDSNLKGLNVTIPFKEQVVELLDELVGDAAEILAVNTIKIVRNEKEDSVRLLGFNTDASGFKRSFTPLLKPHHNGALILGTGGASKAVAFVLNKLQIPLLFVSRSKYSEGFIKYTDLNATVIGNYSIIINTTPCGSFPETDQMPPFPMEHLNSQNLLYDLVYNPNPSKFLKLGAQKGCDIKNGVEMLHNQADLAWEIWSQPDK